MSNVLLFKLGIIVPIIWLLGFASYFAAYETHSRFYMKKHGKIREDIMTDAPSVILIASMDIMMKISFSILFIIGIILKFVTLTLMKNDGITMRIVTAIVVYTMVAMVFFPIVVVSTIWHMIIGFRYGFIQKIRGVI